MNDDDFEKIWGVSLLRVLWEELNPLMRAVFVGAFALIIVGGGILAVVLM